MGFWRLLLAAMLAVLPAAAAAQTQTTPPPQPTTDDNPALLQTIDNQWVASGFVGSNFGSDAEEASMDFGGTVGYLWRGVAGAEFQANFSPDFELEPARAALLPGTQPWINSYMFNAIGAVPVGTEGRWQPYASGGFGALTLRSDALDGNDLEPDDSRAAGNIGFGVMGFMRNIGVRGDVRYFRGFEADPDNPPDELGELVGNRILSDLAFWRANIGLAFRW